jgi:hypothetical protein
MMCCEVMKWLTAQLNVFISCKPINEFFYIFLEEPFNNHNSHITCFLISLIKYYYLQICYPFLCLFIMSQLIFYMLPQGIILHFKWESRGVDDNQRQQQHFKERYLRAIAQITSRDNFPEQIRTVTIVRYYRYKTS